MAPRPALYRLGTRRLPADWGDDDLLTLAEAKALFFPAGPFTATALRSAAERGELSASRICGRLYTTPSAVRRFSQVADGKRPDEVDRLLAELGRRRVRTCRS
jgi:hypothetical protein